MSVHHFLQRTRQGAFACDLKNFLTPLCVIACMICGFISDPTTIDRRGIPFMALSIVFVLFLSTHPRIVTVVIFLLYCVPWWSFSLILPAAPVVLLVLVAAVVLVDTTIFSSLMLALLAYFMSANPLQGFFLPHSVYAVFSLLLPGAFLIIVFYIARRYCDEKMIHVGDAIAASTTFLSDMRVYLHDYVARPLTHVSLSAELLVRRHENDEKENSSDSSTHAILSQTIVEESREALTNMALFLSEQQRWNPDVYSSGGSPIPRDNSGEKIFLDANEGCIPGYSLFVAHLKKYGFTIEQSDKVCCEDGGKKNFSQSTCLFLEQAFPEIEVNIEKYAVLSSAVRTTLYYKHLSRRRAYVRIEIINAVRENKNFFSTSIGMNSLRDLAEECGILFSSSQVGDMWHTVIMISEDV